MCVDGYTIYTTEHCCKNEVETAQHIVASEQFQSLTSLISTIPEDSKSASLSLLEKQLKRFEDISQNELICLWGVRA